MNTYANLATLVLFVYYAVSFTKELIGKLSSDPATSNGIIRIWALLLGLAGAIGDYMLTSHAYDRLGIYTELKLGAAAAVGAIITYHIGQATFKGAFDGGNTSTTTVTVTQPPPVVAEPTVTVAQADTASSVAVPQAPEPAPATPAAPPFPAPPAV